MTAYELSYWEQESFFKGIDVAVIGSGIVGLTAAIHLKTLEPHSRIVVLERGALPTGASTRNAGFACFGSLTVTGFCPLAESRSVTCSQYTSTNAASTV